MHEIWGDLCYCQLKVDWIINPQLCQTNDPTSFITLSSFHWQKQDRSTLMETHMSNDIQASPPWSFSPQKSPDVKTLNKLQNSCCHCTDIASISHNTRPWAHNNAILYWSPGVNSIFQAVSHPWCGRQSAASGTRQSRRGWWRFRVPLKDTSAQQLLDDTEGHEPTSSHWVVISRLTALHLLSPPQNDIKQKKPCSLFLEKPESSLFKIYVQASSFFHHDEVTLSITFNPC